MTLLHTVVTKQKEAKSLLPVRHVAKHNFSRGASTFFRGVISSGINHPRHKSKERDHPSTSTPRRIPPSLPIPAPPSPPVPCTHSAASAVRKSSKIINQKNDLSYPATRHAPSLSPSCHAITLPSSSTFHPSKFIKRVRNQEWLPQYFLIIQFPPLHLTDLQPPLTEPSTHRVTGSTRGLVADRLNVSLSLPVWSSANFRRLLNCCRRWPRGHRVPCFSDPLLQE